MNKDTHRMIILFVVILSTILALNGFYDLLMNINSSGGDNTALVKVIVGITGLLIVDS